MKLADLNEDEVRSFLADNSLKLKIGSFGISISSNIVSLTRHLFFLYKDFKLLSEADFIDFHVSIKTPSLLRSLFRPQVVFSFDGYFPFSPLPLNQADAMFEWGINWCIANGAQQFLIIHAAVIERNGIALIMPGIPGAGKSTLCAALVCSGWRLLSDELALISIDDELVYPLARPVSLKNQSIDVIQSCFPWAYLGSIIRNTAKGSIAHMRPPTASVHLVDIPAKPAAIVFPQYKYGAEPNLCDLLKGDSFLKTARNCFNYNVLGGIGFDLLANLIDRTDSYEFEYHDINDALNVFEQLSLR